MKSKQINKRPTRPKMRKQNKMKTKNPLIKIKHAVHFVLANYSRIWGLPWCVLDTSREKADVPFTSEYQLQIAS